MSKRKSRQSSNLEEKTTPTTEDNGKESISKKMVTSSKTTVTTTTTPIESKTLVKEHVKMTVKDLKNLRNLKKNQEQILMTIENENIQKHVQGLIEKFDPPNCSNCPKRRADRVCINKDCGMDKFMQLICGKCHFDKHQKAINKPEIDIEEYFVKLATFMNEQKYETKKKQVQRIDLDNLETIFDDIDSFRQKLDSLRGKLESEIEGYITPQEMHGILQNGIMKALSQCEYDNIQEQLVNIKKCAIFSKNKFYWNDASEKFKTYQKIFTDLDKNASQTSKKISKSFIGGLQIDLSEIKFLISTSLSYGNTNQSCTEKDGEIKISNSTYNNSQYYMDFKLDREKKYKLRFRFDTQPSQYIMVGVMPHSQAQSNWVYNIQGQFFCKRFYSSSPTQECSRILKGSDIGQTVQKGQQIEMRIDFENHYVDFYDYPDIKNVNANHQHMKFQETDYVIAFSFYQIQNVVIEQFEEISALEDLV